MSYDTEGQYATNARILAEEKAQQQLVSRDGDTLGSLAAEVERLRREVAELRSRPSFDGGKFGEDIADIVRDYVKREIARAIGRVDSQVEDQVANVERTLGDMKDRLGRIEKQPRLKYLGAWQQGSHYTEAQLVTFAGSLWHCNSPTGTQPCASDQCWTMAARKGRDGKETQS
jgi:hypothetical protein